MDSATLSAYLAAAAVGLILAEWTYVVLWTRSVGKKVVGQILSRVNTLRTGRGTNPTAPEALATAADRMAPPAADLDLSNIDLDSPIAQQFLGRIASSLGVDESLVRSYAEKVMTDQPATVPSGPMIRSPHGPQPSRGGADLFSTVLQGVLSGQVGIEDALMAAAPMVLRGLASGQSAGSGEAAHGSGYW